MTKLIAQPVRFDLCGSPELEPLNGREKVHAAVDCSTAVRYPHEDAARCMANELNRDSRYRRSKRPSPWLVTLCVTCRGWHVERDGKYLAR